MYGDNFHFLVFISQVYAPTSAMYQTGPPPPPGSAMYPHPHHQMGIPAQAASRGQPVHLRTSSNLSSGGSSSGHPSSSSLQSSGRSQGRHRPKSNYYDYDFYAAGSGPPHPGSHPPPPQSINQKIMMPLSQQQQQQMYSLPRMQPQQQFFQ